MSVWQILAIPMVCMLSLSAGDERANGSYGAMVVSLLLAMLWVWIFYDQVKERKKKG